MRVLIPSPLVPYTGKTRVEASGATLDEVLRDLDRRYPGIRFRMVDEQDRIRRHVRVFIGSDQVFDLARRLQDDEEVIIVQALTGG
jgi:molybdopterin synthase sulfur carrier subunit